jgi:hypothetical protein
LVPLVECLTSHVEVENFQLSRDRASDDADVVYTRMELGHDLAGGRKPCLVLRPFPERALRIADSFGWECAQARLGVLHRHGLKAD